MLISWGEQLQNQIFIPTGVPNEVQNGRYHIAFLYVSHQSTKQDATGYEDAGIPAEILYPVILILSGEADEVQGGNKTG